MKANELMVGDWVQFTSEQWLTEEDACPLKVTCVGEPKYPDFYPYIRIEGRNENYHIDLFQPISLTTEILEKNGFSGKMYAICEIDENRKLQFYYHEHRLKLYWVGVDEYNNSSVVTDEIFRCHCHYVHELQHALKLCHIEKTIII